MKIPGMQLIEKAESKGNEAGVPMAQNLGLVDFLKLTYKEMNEDHVMAFAGNLTYKALFAVFPFFTFLLSLLGIFNATDLVNTMVDKLSGVVPKSATRFVEDQLLGHHPEPGRERLHLRGDNLDRTRPLGRFGGVPLRDGGDERDVRGRGGQALLEGVRALHLYVPGGRRLALGSLVLVVFGEPIGVAVADLVGLGSVFATVWSILQWPVVACVVLFAFSLIYYFAPAAEQRFRWISPGSIIAFVFWLIFSLLFSLYASTFGGNSYNETYGSLAGVIVLMLYVYYSALIMLVGAEMNQVIEWHIPGGKDEGDKVPEDDRKPDIRHLNREESRDEREPVA